MASSTDAPAGTDVRRPHLIRLEDLTDDTLEEVLSLAERYKQHGRAEPGSEEARSLLGRSLGMLFFRGSLRTRVSVAAAMHQLGGHTIELTAESDAWQLEEREGSRMDGRAPEHVKDAAHVLSSYVDALAVRPAAGGQTWQVDRNDSQIRAWARWSTVPVINMESSLWHPLQALADLLTLREALGKLAGRRLVLAWVHSPRPASAAVAHSVLSMAAGQGMQVTLTHPPGFELDTGVVEEAKAAAERNGGGVHTSSDLDAALDGAQVVYARSWQSLDSYGNPTLAASKRSRATEWRIDGKRMQHTDDAFLMHAMPVRRNLEVTDDVLDGERSLVYTQAENRLHSQRALLAKLLSS